VNEHLSNEIKKARRDARESFKDIDLDILGFDSYGKSYIQSRGLSPDAYIQMALLLTTYLDVGEATFGLTYESCHTRLFREGRTETIRSVTAQSMAFMHQSKFVMDNLSGKTEVISEAMNKAKALLYDACVTHQLLSMESLSGKGIDRHLFALNVAAKGLEVKSEFLDFAHSRLKWSLSSSQQPQMQTRLRDQLPEHIGKEFFCPGGGYAPISDEGYGVAYTITPTQIFFHVTCKKSCAQTNSRRFTGLLKKCFAFMRDLVQL